MNVIQGCTCCGSCDIAFDTFDRVALNVGGPFTWAGNTGAFTLTGSERVVCSTADRYIVASGMPSNSYGQVLVYDVITVSGVCDYIVNWVDTNNYDFCRLDGPGNEMTLYERVGGTNTAKYQYQLGAVAPFIAIPLTLYRHGTVFTALYGLSNTDQGGFAYCSSMSAATSSGTFGMRLHSGTLSVASVDYDRYGSPCPEFSGTCLACSIEDTEAIQLEFVISGITGPCSSMNGTYVLDFKYTEFYDAELSGWTCQWLYDAAGTRIRCRITGSEQTIGTALIEIFMENADGGSGFTLAPSEEFIDCADDTFSGFSVSGSVGAGCGWGSVTVSLEVIAP